MSGKAAEHPETQDLTRGPIARQIVTLAAPIIGTSFIQVAYSFTDMAWVGRLGSREIAALGVISVLTWLASSIGALVKTGAEVLVAQGLGAQNRNSARCYAQHTSTLALYISLGLKLVYGVGGSTFIGLYGLEETTSEFAQQYLNIIIWGLPGFFLSLSYSGVHRCRA